MVLWRLVEARALAALTVQDAAGCLDREAVELEVREAVGDEVVDRLAFVVGLEPVDGGYGSAPVVGWTLRLSVTEGGSAVWDRQIRVQREDCPYLPTLAAQSFESGLSGVPGWSLRGPGRPAPEAGFQTFLTVPAQRGALRMSFGPDLWQPITRAIRWHSTVELQWGAVEQYDLAGMQLAGVMVGTGPGLDLPLSDEVGVRWSHRLGIAAAVSVGLGNVPNYDSKLTLWPRVPYTTDLGLRLGESVRVFGRFEAVILRGEYVIDDVHGDEIVSYTEPLVRLGFGFEVAGMLRTRDVGRTNRE